MKNLIIIILLFLTSLNANIYFTKEELLYLKNKKTITMCIDPDWMPFEKIENEKHIGLASDYIKIAQKSLGIPIILIRTKDWNESIKKAKNRECDIFSMVPIIEKRKKYMNFTIPYLEIPMVIATKIDKHFIDNIEQILNKKIAIVKNYSILNILKKKYPTINIVEVDSIYDGLVQVESDKVFAFIDNLATINYEIDRNFINMLKVSGRLDIRLKYRIATRNDEPILQNIFNKIIINIDRVTKDKIFHKWVNSSQQKTIINYTLIWQLIAIFFIIALIVTTFIIILKRRNKRLTKLLNSTIDGVAIFKNGKLIGGNKVLLNMYGYSSFKDIKGKNALYFVEEKQHDYVKEQLKIDNEPYELNMIKKDKTIFPVLVKGTQLSKNIRLSSVIDLTELKDTYYKLEELNKNLQNSIDIKVDEIRKKDNILQQQSKMASMGEMIGAIAHQWRQPLNELGLSIQNLEYDYKFGQIDEKFIDEFIEYNKKTIMFMSDTIDDFRNFFRVDKEKKNFNVKEKTKSVIAMLSSQIKNNNITLDLIGDDFIYNGFASEYSQMVLNIINNAKDALISNNIINPYIHIFLENESIIIKDNAGGIPNDIIDRVFEPYFTTKEQGKGTGMGLYMSKMIIEDNMGGSLSVENDKDGAIFIINLNKRKVEV